jgi:hypothetical protein
MSPATRATLTAAGEKTPASTFAPHEPTNQANEQPAQTPAALDPGRPEGRLSIGSALFILGILGIIIARRLQRTPER